MASFDLQTEGQIKETAKRIFFQKGHIHATTIEIAKEAGISRAMINYYFRRSNLLFEKVLQEAITAKRQELMDVFSSKKSLFAKVSEFIDIIIEQNIDYPYLQNFIVSELAKNPEKIIQLFPNDLKKLKISETIQYQIDQAIKSGLLHPITVEDFMLNLMSLCNYPLVAKPLMQGLFTLSEDEYRRLLVRRKKVILQSIFNVATALSLD
ncbi:MAG TPA: TetR/AcrR family transcriptional regulator [Ohtaekwangia sp.]|uniref:TetR/AcrR family transcriptional regulator n=1 Tax=Ohtaekwangia sp. TaxID=2066019 RepID=UPI002F9324A1